MHPVHQWREWMRFIVLSPTILHEWILRWSSIIELTAKSRCDSAKLNINCYFCWPHLPDNDHSTNSAPSSITASVTVTGHLIITRRIFFCNSSNSSHPTTSTLQSFIDCETTDIGQYLGRREDLIFVWLDGNSTEEVIELHFRCPRNRLRDLVVDLRQKREERREKPEGMSMRRAIWMGRMVVERLETSQIWRVRWKARSR